MNKWQIHTRTFRWERYIARGCLLLAILLFSQNGCAIDASSKPILRVESGMHSNVIDSIATDAQQNFVVTGGEDGTVRIWQLANGKLLKVIRPPLSQNSEVLQTIVAISPDGETIAVGGTISMSWYGTTQIYLFSRTSGKMLARLQDVPGVPRKIAFSRDGRWLAAGLNRDKGIRIWDTQNLARRLLDPKNEEETTSIAWGQDGKILSASKNGNLRLYTLANNNLELLRSAKARSDNIPSDIAFSPDGNYIALSHSKHAKVDVLATNTLTPIFSADVQDVQNGSLHFVAWSNDGQTLAAVGTWEKDGKTMLRRWNKGGRGAPQDSALGFDNAIDLISLANNKWLLATQYPEWGIVEASGKWNVLAHRQRADFKDSTSSILALSGDGSQVQFSFEAEGTAPYYFDLKAPALHVGKLAQGFPPRTTGLPISGWQGFQMARFGYFTLLSEDGDTNYCLSISEDKNRFIIGSNWLLRIFDGEGHRHQFLRVQSPVWAVNIARNGRFFVAAYDDGVIRWHRMEDGAILLALVPLEDRKNWVLRTPSGFYDASPGALPFIVWHVNRGRDQAADSLPEAQFHDYYFRPDIVKLVLQTLDESKAIDIADGKK